MPRVAGWAAPAAGLAAAGGLAIVVAGEISTAPLPERGRELASVSLTTDRRGALFTEGALVPGQTVTRCIVVRYQGPAQDRSVRLVAEDLGGPLLPSLNLVVRVGTGGSGGGCAGCADTTVFDGRLRGLATESASGPGVSTGWRPGVDSERTFAFSVRIPDDAPQRASAAARFRWILEIDEEPPPVAVPSAAPPEVEDPPEVTASELPASAAPAPSGTPTPAPTATATPSVGASGTGSGAHGGTRKRAKEARGVTGRLRAWADPAVRAAVAVQRLAVRSSRHTAVPLGSLAVLLVFLVIQNRLDRRDPKLAEAPVTGDRFVSFRQTDEPPEGVG